MVSLELFGVCGGANYLLYVLPVLVVARASTYLVVVLSAPDIRSWLLVWFLPRTTQELASAFGLSHALTLVPNGLADLPFPIS